MWFNCLWILLLFVAPEMCKKQFHAKLAYCYNYYKYLKKTYSPTQANCRNINHLNNSTFTVGSIPCKYLAVRHAWKWMVYPIHIRKFVGINYNMLTSHFWKFKVFNRMSLVYLSECPFQYAMQLVCCIISYVVVYIELGFFSSIMFLDIW